MDVAALLARVAVDVAVVVCWSLLVGLTAPRWPRRWLERDAGPLRLSGRDTAARYRRLGAHRLVALLPEGGAWLGGSSKRRLPGTDERSLTDYLVEVRRAEWVHLLSMLSAVPPLVLGPWWLGLSFAVVIVAVNALFVLVLRYNRVRLTGILRRARVRGQGSAPRDAAGQD